MNNAPSPELGGGSFSILWFPLVSTDYSLIEGESGGSVLKVYEEGTLVKATLGSYNAL